MDNRSGQVELTHFIKYFLQDGAESADPRTCPAVQLSKCLPNTEPLSLGQHCILIDKGSIPEVGAVFLKKVR